MTSIPPNIASKLKPQQLDFFEHLSNYIDKPLHFYGSITRFDYFPGKSDIDIAIFSENEQIVIYQLSSMLNVKKHQFKKIVYRVDDMVVQGYKLRYADPTKLVETEISVYNDRYQKPILQDHQKDNRMPFYVCIMLYVVKVLFYYFHVLSKRAYKRAKQFLMNDNDQVNFIEIS